MALKSIYPPCRQCLPHQASSNQDEIWGRASSQGQQHEAGRVGGAAAGRWADQAFNVSSTIWNPFVDKRSVKRTSSVVTKSGNKG